MLETRDLTLHYGHSQILHGISMGAQAGRVTCVMGTNGVGKTSLLKAITGTHPASGGSVILGGSDVTGSPAHALARQGVAYVPQGRDIFPLLTVRENLQTGFACLPKDQQGIPDRIFDLFPILRDFLNRRGGDLSGGQQQQLAIARALISRPRLLLLDEPTEGIQPNIIKQIGDVIRLLRQEGEMAIVLVEQFFDFAHDLGDHFVVMERGAVTWNRPATDTPRDDLLAKVSV